MQKSKSQVKNKNLPKGWRKVKLGEIVYFTKGKKPEQIFDKKVSKDFCHYILLGEDKNYVKPDQSLVKVFPSDIIMVADGASSGVIFANQKGILGSTLLRIRIKPKYENEIDTKYLYFFLKFSENIFRSILTGSAIPHIDQENLRIFEVFLPKGINEQKRIASILSAFDDKIELNNKISAVLEQMAQAIFKEKLKTNSEKLPKGWELKELGDIADVQWGDTTVTKSSYVEKGYPAYSASGQDGFREKYDFDRTGVVLSAIGANCGLTWLAKGKWSVIKNTIRFWSTVDGISTEYLFLATKGQNTWPQRGSAQPFIALGDARKRKVLIPPKDTLRQINDFIVGAYAKIDTMRLENQKLATLRDLLLPKLMSGEIAV